MTLAGLEDTGTTEPTPTTTERTIVSDAATTGLRLDSFHTFRVVGELTEDTLHRAAP